MRTGFVEFNPFDVTTKELIWDGPVAWLERFGIGPPGPVEVIDSDITVLTAVADKVIKVGSPEPYLVNLELQSSHDKELIETTWFRQAALYRRHRLPVLTILVLLRREANSPTFTGEKFKRSACGTAGRRTSIIIGWCECGRKIPNLT